MAPRLHPLAVIFKDLIVLNNTFLLSAPWIVSPTKPPHGEPPRPGLHPIIGASMYAVVQPLSLAVIFSFGGNLWVLLLAMSGSYVWSTNFITVYWNIKTARHIQESEIEKALAGESKDDKESSNGQSMSLARPEIMAWLTPIFDIAICDAALLALVAELYSYPEAYDPTYGEMNRKVNYYFAFFAVALYLGCRLVDSFVVSVTHRRGVCGVRSYTWRECRTLVLYLAYFNVARSAVAYLVEWYTGYPILRLLTWPRNVTVELPRDNIAWLAAKKEEIFGGFNIWLLPVMWVVGNAMQWYGSARMERAARID